MTDTRERINLLLAGAVGTTLEWYDFFVFAACAVLVFDKSFFAAADPFVALVLSLGTFAAGFLARPLGGVVLGALGDSFGRKKILVWSLVLMGAATFAMGLLPNYAQIGPAAPILLLLLRILQGIAVGGEATGALLIIAESMPAADRGFWTSFSMLSGPLANVLAAGAIGLVQRGFGEQAFVDWAWRLPFLASALLVGLGLVVRRRLHESPAFAQISETRGRHPAIHPLREALRHCRASMARVFLIKWAENSFLYLFSTFLLLLATRSLGFSRAEALNALLLASLVEVAAIPLAAVLSDRIGRRPVLLAGLVWSALAGLGLFALPPGADFGALFRAIALCLIGHGLIVGAMGAFFSELFPTRLRFTALSASYQLAAVFGGSLAPLIGAFLLEKTGSALSVGLYAAILALPAALAAIFTRETRGLDFSAQEIAFETRTPS